MGFPEKAEEFRRLYTQLQRLKSEFEADGFTLQYRGQRAGAFTSDPLGYKFERTISESF